MLKHIKNIIYITLYMQYKYNIYYMKVYISKVFSQTSTSLTYIQKITISSIKARKFKIVQSNQLQNERIKRQAGINCFLYTDTLK